MAPETTNTQDKKLVNALAGGEEFKKDYLCSVASELAYYEKDIFIKKLNKYGKPIGMTFPKGSCEFFEKKKWKKLAMDSQAYVVFNSRIIMVVFRGSELNLADWANNVMAKFKIVGDYRDRSWKYTYYTRAHHGFNRVYNSLVKKGLVDYVKKNKGNRELWICGHSQGGAVAAIAAYRMSNEHDIFPSRLCTFASPRPGDSTFRRAMKSIPNMTSVRYVYRHDLAPRLLHSTNFCHVHGLVSIRTNKRRRKNRKYQFKKGIRYKRAKSLVKGIKDHSMVNYVRALETTVPFAKKFVDI